MSTGSFDDSSNLVDIASPASNGEPQKETYEKHDEKQLDLLAFPDETEEQDIKPKHKKSFAKKLLKRAKSPLGDKKLKPFKEISKEFKGLKNLPKHHYKTPKSPAKSPSKENLTEEYSHLEEKLGEKKGEEWLAFQQMQDRIKQTVLKTQQSLGSKTGNLDEKSEGLKKWTGFDDDESLEPEELIDTSIVSEESSSEPISSADNPVINVSLAAYSTGTRDNTYQDFTKDLSYLQSSPSASPPVTPAPPVNSRIASMENLMEAVAEEKDNGPNEFDLLGLSSSTEPVQSKVPSSDLMNQDLLGLDSCLSPVGSSTNQIISTGSKSLGGYTYSLSSTLTQSEKSSQSSTPIEFDQSFMKSELSTQSSKTNSSDSKLSVLEQDSNMITKSTSDTPTDKIVHNVQDMQSDMIGFESDIIGLAPSAAIVEAVKAEGSNTVGGFDPTLLGDPLQPSPFDQTCKDNVVQQSMQNTDNEHKSQNVLDDFADLDPMKSTPVNATPTVTSNMFSGAISSPVNIPGAGLNPQMGIYGTSPSTAYGSAPVGEDLMSKIKRMSNTGSQPVSPARQFIKTKHVDHFGFVTKEIKPDETDDGSYKPMVKLENKSDIKGEHPETTSTQESITVENQDFTNNNPFLSGDFDAADIASFSNEGFNSSANVAEVFGVEPVVSGHTQGEFCLEEQWPETNSTGENKAAAWADLDAEKPLENVWEDTDGFVIKEGSAKTKSAWESTMISTVEVTSGEGMTSSGTNPFQDDFSALETIQITETDGTNISAHDVGNVNPFLGGDIMDSQLVQTGTINPFLDFATEAQVGGSSTVSGGGNLLMDTMEENVDSSQLVDDMFDPFKVAATKSEDSTVNPTVTANTLDIFTNETTTGDNHITKCDTDHGFVLEIKPLTERPKGTESDQKLPTLKPPPKPPKSPQPPRENPFDRDSPPEENFAQFEIMDTDKPKELPPKSISTDSYTTDEEDSNVEPLSSFLPVCEKEGFRLMLRYPTKKKITGNRYWKNVYVKVMKQNDGPLIKVLTDPTDALPMQELPLQACYSLSDLALQQYDQYGKIHTVKLQYVFYKERVGMKTDRIAPSILKLKHHKPKATMILDHSPQVSELLKFGSLNKEEIVLFMHEVENALMNLEAHREKTLTYTKDEVTAVLHDEYEADLDKHGKVLSQKARIRIFILAFVTGMPILELGLNDRRRRGKEVVGRCDIIPIKTEEWIKLENVEFHCCVDKDEFEKTNNIKFRPLDACQFELLRYRVRPRENKELPLQLTIQQIFKDRKVEVRCDLLVTGYHSFSKKHGQFPCEDIEVRLPMPDVWIYMFRYERRFGYGSFKSTTRKPGKIKGLERLTQMAQGTFSQALMEADVGTAKYEHLYRSVVWRIPRLPVRNQGAYTSHLMKLKLELGPHDETPESFEQYANVEFTMPCATVSQSQIRSIAITNPTPPEKWVRYLARYEYRIEIEHLDEYPELVVPSGGVYEDEVLSTQKSESDTEEKDAFNDGGSDSDDSSD